MLHTLVLILRYHCNINIDVLYGRKKDGFSSFNRVFFQKACKMASLDMLDAIAYIWQSWKLRLSEGYMLLSWAQINILKISCFQENLWK